MPKNNTEESTSWEIRIIMDSEYCNKYVYLGQGYNVCESPEREDEKPRRCIKSLCPRVYER